MKKLINLFFLLLIALPSLAVKPVFRLYAEKSNANVKIVWITDRWDPAIPGVILKMKSGNSAWQEVFPYPIRPALQPETKLNERIQSNRELLRISEKAKLLFQSGKLQNITEQEFLNKIKEDPEAIRGLNMAIAIDADMAFLMGLGAILNLPANPNTQWAIFSETTGEQLGECTFTNIKSGPEELPLSLNVSASSKTANPRLRWQVNYNKYQNSGTNGYNVYRLSNQNSWLRLNKTPIWLSSLDSLAEGSFLDRQTPASQKATYAVAPLSLLGTEGKKQTYSWIPPRFPEPITPPVLALKGKSLTKNIPLSWTFLKTDESQITGIFIQRMQEAKENWRSVSPLLPPDSRNWEDTRISNKESGHYLYRMLLVYGKDTVCTTQPIMVYHEAVLIPDVPKNLRANVIREENKYFIDLKWDPKANTDEATDEYRIYANRPPSKEILLMANLETVKENHVRIPIYNTLGDEYCFRIAARSKSRFESKLSDTLCVYVPGNYVISPSLMPVKVDSNLVTLNWQHDFRKDLKGFQVMINGVPVAKEDQIRQQSSSWSAHLEYGKTYVFELVAINKLGQKSDPSFRRVVTVERRNRY